MSKYTPRVFVKKALLVLLGTMVCAYGICLVLASGVGVDPLTMFQQGLAKTLGVSVSAGNWIVNMSVLLLGFILNRRQVGWGSLITSFCMGPFIALWSPLTPVAPDSFVVGLLINALGVAVCGLGIAIYMLQDFGVGAMETMMTYFSDKFHKSYRLVRICMDCTWLVLGILLGGSLGVGTVIGAFGLGIALDFFCRLLTKLFIKPQPEQPDAR